METETNEGRETELKALLFTDRAQSRNDTPNESLVNEKAE